MKGSNGISVENEYCDDISWIIHDINNVERNNSKNNTSSQQTATPPLQNEIALQDPVM